MLCLPWPEIDRQTIAATRFLSADFCKRRAVVLRAQLIDQAAAAQAADEDH